MSLCQFCNNSFTSNVSLYNHQRKAKYCIDIQKSNNADVKSNSYACKWCNKLFNAKYNYERHIEQCKNEKESNPIYIEMQSKITHQSEEICNMDKLIKDQEVSLKSYEIKIKNMDTKLKNRYTKIKNMENKITELEDELNKDKSTIEEQKLKIVELSVRLEKETEIKGEFKDLHTKKEECIEKIAMQPKYNSQTSNQSTTQHNQNILNNLPVFNITKEQLQKAAETDFSLELFLQGQVGVAKFTIGVFRQAHDDDLPWIVSDQARGIFKTKDKDGNILVDPRAERLTAMVMDAVKEKNKQHHDSFYPKRNYNSDDERDEAEIDREGQIELDEQIRADNCYLEILKIHMLE